MPQDYYSLVTNAGLIKEAKAGQIGGVPINLTEIAIGDSLGSYYEPDPSATSLLNELYRTNLTSAVLDAKNPNQLIIEGVIDEEAGPFYIREVGIFDADGDLFAIGKYPETFKPSFTSGSGKRLYIRMIVGFVSTPNVEIIISENINFDPNFESNLNDKLDLINNDISDRLKISQNLADLSNVQTARNNLGLKESAITDFTASILPFAIIPPPTGWLECNGAAISRTTYANLFSKIGTTYGPGNNSTTFNIPDLRGEFIRGFDNGRGIDSGRNFATFQDQSIQAHKHAISGSGGSAGAGSNPGNNSGQWDSGAYTGKNTFTTIYNLSGITRPRNIALAYCIKY